MRRLGISIYPNVNNDYDTLKKYIDKALEYNYKRIFTNLLDLDATNKNTILHDFKSICKYARKKGMEVVVDVNPEIFTKLKIKPTDTTFFENLGATVIRLDSNFDGFVESQISNNPEQLLIEINASNPALTIENIISHHGNRDRIIACHNFYPQRYTGLDYRLFYNISKRLKKQNVRLAAFIALQDQKTQGPWEINDKMPTLEIHRDLPLDFQARHLFATDVIDDVIISTQFATDEELESLSKLDFYKVNMKITLEKDISEIEEKIIFDHPHFVRPDISSFLVRSTMPRITYKDESIESRNEKKIKTFKPGDIVILNNGYGRYKGELQVILREIENDGKRNLVGKLIGIEQSLMSFLQPYRQFKFIK